MAFCSYCGCKIDEKAKYCNGCGEKVKSESKQIHIVETRVCPQCGDLINSFAGKCQSCGAELFGIKVSESIKEFSENLELAESAEQKVNFIKTFPIPNTKEDIWEYLILASSNIGYSEVDNSVSEEFEEAWVAKFIQCYQKAKLVFENDYDYKKVQQIFDETMLRLDNATTKRNLKGIGILVAKNIGAIVGMIVALVALWMNVAGENSSMMELLSIVLLIVSACTLKKRGANYLEYGIAVASGLIPIAFSFLLHNGAVFELGGAIVLVIVAVNFFGNISGNKMK